MRGSVLSTSCLILALASGCTDPLTEVVVRIQTDLTVPSQVDAFSVALNGPFALTNQHVALTGQNAVPLPAKIAIVPGDDPAEEFRITVTALRLTVKGVHQEVVTFFSPDSARELDIRILNACATVTCAADQTCDQPPGQAVAGCAPRLRAAGTLPTYVPGS
jgi:hypothetical protein